MEQAGSKRKMYYLGRRAVARREVGKRHYPIPRGHPIGTHRLWIFSLANVDRVYAEHCSLPPAAGSGRICDQQCGHHRSMLVKRATQESRLVAQAPASVYIVVFFFSPYHPFYIAYVSLKREMMVASSD